MSIYIIVVAFNYFSMNLLLNGLLVADLVLFYIHNLTFHLVFIGKEVLSD
jgi:hypothetical protein